MADTDDTNETDDSVTQEHWFKSHWRPSMAWLYMAICAFDFILFPLMTMAYFQITKGVYVPWIPITLSNGGLIHVAFGAVIGVSAWSRGREKLQGAN